MNYFSWPQFHTNDSPALPLADPTGNGRNISNAQSAYAEMKPQGSSAGYARIAGSVAITNATQGVVTLTWAAADVAVVGLFYFRIVVNYGGALKPYEALLTITP